MKNLTLQIDAETAKLHTQVFRDLLNCRAIIVEGHGKELSINFDLVYADDCNSVYSVSVIDEHENMFKICRVHLSPSKFVEGNKAQVIVNINTDIEPQFDVPYKNFKVAIFAEYVDKDKLSKSNIKCLYMESKRIYPSIAGYSTILENAFKDARHNLPTLSFPYDKDSLMALQFKREQKHNELYLYGIYGAKDYQASLAPQTPLDCSEHPLHLKRYNERKFIVTQLKTRPKSSDDYYMNFTAMDYLDLIDPLTNYKDKHFTDAIVSVISSVKTQKSPMQHKHPFINKETTIMQTNTARATFPPVTYSVTTGFLALADNVRDTDFKTLLESFTDDHALDFLGTSNIIFDQIGAYVNMVSNDKLVHPSVKSLSKVVTFSFCYECLNEYSVLAVEYLNDEYKKLTGVDYDFINISSSHTEGREELLKAFVKKYKRNPGVLPAKAPKVMLQPRVSKAKLEKIVDIYSPTLTSSIYVDLQLAINIHNIVNIANNGTPSAFKSKALIFGDDLSNKLLTIYRKSI